VRKCLCKSRGPRNWKSVSWL